MTFFERKRCFNYQNENNVYASIEKVLWNISDKKLDGVEKYQLKQFSLH